MTMPEEENKQENKKEDNKVIFEARIHCESCRCKVHDAIVDYPGVESIEFEEQKVTVKGKVDACKLFATANKRSGHKITKLLYPEPKRDNNKEEKKDEKKKEPVDVTVVLKAQMHCGECAEKVRKTAKKMKGVYDVIVDGEKVTLKGKDLDAKTVCQELKRKSGKHVEVVVPPNNKKEGDKGDGEQKEDGELKKDVKEGDPTNNKKEGKQNSSFKATPNYVFAPQYFSDDNPHACLIM